MCALQPDAGPRTRQPGDADKRSALLGKKNDAGKLRYDLIPPDPLREVARVYTIGSTKYQDYNWLHGMNWSRVIAALFRHMEAWREGRTVDPDDGQHPLASVIWCAMTLLEFERLGVGRDDRQITLLEEWAKAEAVEYALSFPPKDPVE